MPVPQNLQNVPQSAPPVDGSGLFVRVWYMFFQSAVTAVNYLLGLDFVFGGSTLLAIGSIPKITAKGTLGPSSLKDTIQRTQSQLSGLAATLMAADKGLLVEITDFGHILKWSGTAWGWGPAEQGSGMLVPFAVAPTGSGWHLCDGSGVSYLKSDGTLGSVTLPNTAGSAAYVQLGSGYSPTISAATPPTISTPTISTPTISIGSASLGTSGFSTGGTAAVNQTSHSHSASSSTPTSSTPTATLSADPVAHFSALLYFRQ